MFFPPPAPPPEDSDPRAPPEHSDPWTAEARAVARTLLEGGMTPDNVEQRLVERGVHRVAARVMVAEVATVPRPAADGAGPADYEDGWRTVRYGALWIAGGLIVTMFTFAVAAGGGSYVIAWGAMLYGAIQFVRGASRVAQAPRPSHSRPVSIPVQGSLPESAVPTPGIDPGPAQPAEVNSDPATNRLIRAVAVTAVALAALAASVCLWSALWGRGP
jgi:hypothetical protein